ncbi:MAG: FtsX-like permease family protein [Ilumatobacteraceae bacterium]
MYLALKEMRRARVRFGLLAGAVGLLVYLILFQQAISTGLIDQFIGALKNQSADVLVYNAQARRNLEGSIVLPEQSAAIAEVEGVAVAAPLGEGTFTVVAGDPDADEQDAVIFGYQLGGPGEPTTLTAGRLPERTGEAVASSRNAADGFDVGDTVTVVPNAGGTATSFTVVGLAEEINYSVAPTLFTDFVGYDAARRAVNPDATDVLPSVVAVHVAEGAAPAEVAEAITAAVDGTEALTRQQAVDESPGVSAVRQSFSVILLLFYLVAPLVTGLFFLIVTFQKAGALTLLRAIGAPAGLLVRSLVVQVAAVVVSGAAVAVGLFWLTTRTVIGSISVPFDLGAIGFTVGLVLVLALVTSLAAIRRVLRIEPIAATTGAGVHL